MVLCQRNARKFERLFGEITIYLAPSCGRGFIIYRRKEIELQVVKIKIRDFSLFFYFFFCNFPLFSADLSKKALKSWFWFLCFCGANLSSRAHSLVKFFFRSFLLNKKYKRDFQKTKKENVCEIKLAFI